ncbi:MAG: Crp/Fnr family transcriptional regulator [Saprospiraceae bacterium]|nr:Crp/Fnr family transcriptional regulator [Saprospiraceae bacterium]
MDINSQLLIERHLGYLPLALRQEMQTEGQIQTIPSGVELLREGQYVKVIPIVLSGLIKVIGKFEEKDLLLYYIQPRESCIMSFAAVLDNEPSRVVAITEESTIALLLPSRCIDQWVRQYPAFNRLFYQLFDQRYEELLRTIHLLLYEKMDHRLLAYLQRKAQLKQQKQLQLRHWEIAQELGTAREVVTRVLKKLETEGHIRQLPHGQIEVL